MLAPTAPADSAVVVVSPAPVVVVVSSSSSPLHAAATSDNANIGATSRQPLPVVLMPSPSLGRQPVISRGQLYPT